MQQNAVHNKRFWIPAGSKSCTPCIYLVCSQTSQRHGLASKTCSAATWGAKLSNLAPVKKKKVQTPRTQEHICVWRRNQSISINFEFSGQLPAQCCLISKWGTRVTQLLALQYAMFLLQVKLLPNPKGRLTKTLGDFPARKHAALNYLFLIPIICTGAGGQVDPSLALAFLLSPAEQYNDMKQIRRSNRLTPLQYCWHSSPASKLPDLWKYRIK